MEQVSTPPRRSSEEAESWLVARISAVSGLPEGEIDIDSPFVDYQLDSAVAVTVTSEFSRWLGRELPITTFWEHPTIRSLAKAVAEESSSQAHSAA